MWVGHSCPTKLIEPLAARVARAHRPRDREGHAFMRADKNIFLLICAPKPALSGAESTTRRSRMGGATATDARAPIPLSG